MILGFFLPFAFLPFFRMKYLLLSLLIYAQIFFGAAGPSGLILQTQYATLFLPALMLSFIFALKKIKDEKISLLSLKGISGTIWQFLLKDNLGICILIVAIIYSSLTLGPIIGSVSKNLMRFDSYSVLEKNAIMSLIPQKSSTAAAYDYLSPLSSRERLYALNYFFIARPFANQKLLVLYPAFSGSSQDFYFLRKRSIGL